MPCTTLYKTVPVPRDLIPSLGQAKQQVLWIGCSDSSFAEMAALDLLPDESIVLRNIGNMFLDDDLTCQSMVQYAVDMLEVKHIIICGHYGCGLVKPCSNAGLGDPWLKKLKALRLAFADAQLHGLVAGDAERRFVELNVLAQMQSLPNVAEIARAMDSRGLEIHGLVYDASKNEAVRLQVQPEEEEHPPLARQSAQ